MSETPKSPAQLMNDLTDQVRLLRQDVVNLTATATTKKEAAVGSTGQRNIVDLRCFERTRDDTDWSPWLVTGAEG